MKTADKLPSPDQDSAKPRGDTAASRRTFLGATLALGVASVGGGIALLAPGRAKADADQQGRLDPRYFPLRRFDPEISLAGKLAVITGASRGNGRAIGEALTALGVDVIGTSRNPATVPNPPAFPLLKLDIADPNSVLAFPAQLAGNAVFQRHGQVDILCNNAGRLAIGGIVPTPPTNPAFFSSQRDLAVRTLYSGHVLFTNVILASFMPNAGYARIIFTVSIASYYTGFGLAGGSFTDTYQSAKAALRSYANALAGGLREAGSNIRVSTVNPYAMNTSLAEHPHPIYTQPVDSAGLSSTDQVFNAVITGFRQLLASAQPTTRIGTTYAQLLQMANPAYNVVVASPREPFATQGANAAIEQALLTENQYSAVPIY